MSDGLAASLSLVIAPVSDGRVTVRMLPEGREAAASVVVTSGATTGHLEFSDDGTLLVRA